jgi:hypothetical protein
VAPVSAFHGLITPKGRERIHILAQTLRAPVRRGWFL